MAIQRLDNVGIVVEDMDAAIAFFVELVWSWRAGRRSRASSPTSAPDSTASAVTSRWSGPRTVTAGSSWRSTAAPRVISAGPRNRPHNILARTASCSPSTTSEDTVARLRPHGAELVGEIARFEDSYLLCYVRGRRASSSDWPSNCA